MLAAPGAVGASVAAGYSQAPDPTQVANLALAVVLTFLAGTAVIESSKKNVSILQFAMYALRLTDLHF